MFPARNSPTARGVAITLDRTIVALDYGRPEDALEFLKKAGSSIPWAKVGLELFCAGGREFVHQLSTEYGTKIFLDLKFHDIPNTVSRAIRALEGLPVQFLTLHLSGGREMLQKAVSSAREVLPDCQLLGVSYLTSLDQNDFRELYTYSEKDIPAAFERLFDLAETCGLDGVVCSGWELLWVKNRRLLKVCPGIRFAGDSLIDQKRTYTPEAAFAAGADYIVMGRSLTCAMDLPVRLQKLKALKF